MSNATHHLAELVRAWAAGRPARDVPADAAVPVWDLLTAHNVEAVLGPLLPESRRPGDHAERIRASRQRTELLLLELERIAPLVGEAGWSPIVLKGAALALETYREPTDRWFLDLDLLVPRGAVDGVCRRLEEAGYRPLQSRRDPLFYEKHHLHRILLGPQGAVVEVHWDLTLPRSVYRCDLDGVRNRARPLWVGRQQMLAVAPVDQVLHEVYQHIADGYLDLRRVLDMVLLTRNWDKRTWLKILDVAAKAGLNKGLWLSLHIMKQISGVGAPEVVMETLAPGPATCRTLGGLDVASGCLSRRATRDPAWTPLLHLLLTPTTRQQARETFRAAWVGEENLLDRGYPADRLPGFGERTRLGLGQLQLLARMAGRGLGAFVSG